MKSAGQDTDSYCSKCKLELAHVIIAMDGPRIVRVQCKTCMGIHAYKSKLGAKAQRKSSVRKKATAKKKEPSFDEILLRRDVSQAKPYKISVEFGEQDVVDHKSFGLGVVTRVMSGQKVEIMFQVGPKILVHGRG